MKTELVKHGQEPIEGEFIAAGEFEEPILNASQRAAKDRARAQDDAVALQREIHADIMRRQNESLGCLSQEEMARRQQSGLQSAGGLGGELYGLGAAGLGIFR
jgi:hypothetical protein